MDGPRPAGFWLRTGALIVDLIVFTLVQLSFEVIGRRLTHTTGDDAGFQAAVAGFTLLFVALYEIVLHAAAGQTLGKALVGARVVTLDGELPTFGVALLRWIGYFASAATFFVGFLMAGLRRDKRALHDLIAGTRVERLVRETAQTAATESDRAEPVVPSDTV